MIESLANSLRLFPWVKHSVTIYREWRTSAIEHYLHIRTGSAYGLDYLPSTHLGDGYPYVPADYTALWRYMRPIRLSRSDVVVDIGCGMGRVLCMFARRPISKCVGVECDAELAAIARQNATTLRGPHAPIEVRIGDAAEIDYSDGTVFWMFNPFGKRTLLCVLELMEQSLRVSPRPIQIVYVRPEHEDVLRARESLRCLGRQTAPLHHTCGTASYWTNVSPT